MRKEVVRLFGAGVLMLLTLLIGCGSGDANANDPVLSTPRQAGSLEFTLTSAKTAYKLGDTVSLTFTVKNVGAAPVTYVASPPTLDYTVTQGSQLIWQYSRATNAGGAAVNGTIQPGATLTSDVTWNQTKNDGTTVPGSQYAVKAWLNATDVNGAAVAQPQVDLASNPITISLTLQ